MVSLSQNFPPELLLTWEEGEICSKGGLETIQIASENAKPPVLFLKNAC